MKVLALLLCAFALVQGNVFYDAIKNHMKPHPKHGADMDWWEGGVFYQIYPRSFKDSNDDGSGDLKGIIEKLPHLKELGVTGAWLSPIFDSPMVDGGYDISDFKNVNPLFGSNEDLEKLFETAQSLGLKMILDFVPNHTSDKHQWFINSVNRVPGYEDFYVWHNGRTNPSGGQPLLPNNWLSVFSGNAWTWNEQRKQYYLHQFAKEQPDLNYENPAVHEEMKDVLKFWIEKGVHGFRVDAINHAYEDPEFRDEPLKEGGNASLYGDYDHIYTMNYPQAYDIVYGWREYLEEFAAQNEVPTILLMTEAYASLEKTMLWYGNGERKGGHIPFNFALIMDLDKNSNALDFKTVIELWMDNMPEGASANWVLGNHDRPRIAYRYGEDRHESLAILTMFLPGQNVIYYGEEILMNDNRIISLADTQDPQAKDKDEATYQQFTRDPVRTPMQWSAGENAGFSNNSETWLPIHENFLRRNVKAQTDAPLSTFKLYQKMIELRHEHVLMEGKAEFKSINDDKVFVIIRSSDYDDYTYTVLINLDATRQSINLKSVDSEHTHAKVVIATTGSVYTEDTEVDIEKPFVIGRYDAVVLQMSSAGSITVSLVLLCMTVLKFFFF